MTDNLPPRMLTEDEYLEHFGVKGMKWGKRQAASNTSHVSADAARVNKIAARVKKNGTDNLSNDDLAKLNKRNQLMSDYKRNNPSKLKRGAEGTKSALKVVKDVAVVVGVGLGVAGAIATSASAREGAIAVAKALKGL